MRSMFCEAKLFNQNISSWDTSNIEEMNYMFLLTSKFKKYLSNWNYEPSLIQ